MSAKQRRQALRMSAGREVTAVESMLANPSLGGGEQLQRKGVLLKSYLDKLEEWDTKVLNSLKDEDEIEAEIEQIQVFNDSVMEAIAGAQTVRVPMDHPGNHSQGENSILGAGPKVKLPKLEIPAFSGDPIHWQEFWDAFKSAIHDRADLATVDKFNYLRGLLKGEALRLIEGYRITEANYPEVVTTLKERFGDQQAVIFAHIDALLSLPSATGDVASLQATHDEMERHMRSLDSLQPGQDMILFSIIMSKLPRFLKVEAHRKKGSKKDWSLADLREWLQEEVRARDMGERMHHLKMNDRKDDRSSLSRKVDSSKPPRFASNGRKFATTTSAMVSQAKGEQPCPFCKASHSPDQCDRFKDIDSRRAQLHDRCYSCLGRGHTTRDCRKKKPCSFCKRSGHHSSLCFAKLGRPRSQNLSSVPQGQMPFAAHHQAAPVWAPNPLTPMTSSIAIAPDGTFQQTVMQTAIAYVHSGSGSVVSTARLFFDTGASRSFITEKKCQELGLPVIRTEWMSVSTFQSSQRQTMEHKVVELCLKCRDGSTLAITTSVVPTITCPILKVPLGSMCSIPAWALAEPLASHPELVDIDVLIGMDFYYTIISGERVIGHENLWFIPSKLGFIAAGRVSTEERGPESVAVMLLKTLLSDDPVSNPVTDLSRYWELEELGMKEAQDKGASDEEAITSFSSTVRFEAGRYQVQWPWKDPRPELLDNYGLAYGRLKSLLKRLVENPTVLKTYNEVFQLQIDQGIIETVPEVPSGELVYYMPHHGVFNPENPTTKLRIVFDASSKVGKDTPSLNDCLHRGPVLLEDLCGLLLRFRTHPVALVSDIEKAFLQVGLQPSQRDVTRFLWLKDSTLPVSADNVIVYRFARVPFGVISSPFLLAVTIAHHLKQQNSDIAHRILSDIYVDNVITGEASLGEALHHYDEAKKLFQDAAMNLREWYSNAAKVMEHIPEVDHGKESEPKVLGLKWSLKNDTLRCCAVQKTDVDSPVTKRSVLKVLPQVFDPCGFLAPVIVVGKMLVQDLGQLGLGWDDPAPDDLVAAWRHVHFSLSRVSQIEVPRQVGDPQATGLQLHVFCDASARGCAAVVYLRMEKMEGYTSVDLLMAKTRLAPVKQKLTIPRLELVAVVLGVRLLQFVEKHLKLSINKRFAWTDSQCVLYWLLRNQVSTRFVENRLKELRKLSDIQFRYVPTADNPADVPTRGCSLETLQYMQVWWHGPSWLASSVQAWPVSLGDAAPPSDTEVAEPVHGLINEALQVSGRFMDENKFSSLGKLLRVTCYVKRFISNLRKTPTERVKAPLQRNELSDALVYWIRIIQKESFPNPSASSLKQLSVFADSNGVFHCSGRVQFADIPYEAKYPMLLPKSGHFTELVIMDSHQRVLHSGIAQTLASVRQQFWIIQGRATVKRVLRTCRLCRKVEGGAFRPPPMPPLPQCRLDQQPAFSCTGLDYLGPLLINTVNGNSKVWICLFTCASTRAIYLEVVEDMTAENFLLAFRRFVATYGPPLLVISDNAKQFYTASRILVQIWSKVRESGIIKDFLVGHNIEWRFITQLAPWMGGFYERLVGIVKRGLKKSLHGRRVSLVELRTVVAEISAVVNSRPLVYVEDEVGSVPLSPMHLISPLRRKGGVFIPSQDVDPDFQEPPTASQLMARWRRLQGLVTNFWRAWKSEYLLGLRERHSHHSQRGTESWKPAVGTVVHMKENTLRSCWQMGTIKALHPSSDGHIRSVSVQTPGGKLFRRPIRLLYPFEIGDDFSGGESADTVGDATKTLPPLWKKPRVAATKARMRFKQQLNDDPDSSFQD